MQTRQYKWQLRKGSRKEICPNCGQKRFVPYVLTEDGKTIAGAEYGRCDREQSCGYSRYPDGGRVVVREPIEVKPKEMLIYRGTKQPFSFMDTELFYYAAKLFGTHPAFSAFMAYGVGALDEKTIIWWQIDSKYLKRTGKVMRYNADGHRDKNAVFPVTWAHKHKAFTGNWTGEELCQCLFGEFLLNYNKDKLVVVVESEKTAVLMSVIYPEYLWIATGGSQGIKSDVRMQPLFGRRVVLMPDNGQYWNWLRIAEMRGWKCSDYCEKNSIFDGCDIWDIAEKHLNDLEYEKNIL